MQALFSGRLPYFDFDYEHLPGAIAQMALAWLLGGSKSLQTFALAFAGLSFLLIAVTGVVLLRLEDRLGPGLAVRWATALVPLLPFLLFRNDNLPVLFAASAFWLALRPGPQTGGTGSAWLGIMCKAWPGVWAAIDWWRGRRTRAVLTVLLTVAMLALLRTPPVLDIQRPVGVHTETLAGSFLGVFRFVRGLPLQLEQTSALYINAAWWAHLINVAPAIAIGVSALAILRKSISWPFGWLLFGALSGTLILASPLFSTQYMAWVTPFAAAARRRTWLLLVVVNVVSLALIGTWQYGLRAEGWWFCLVLGRNLLFVLLLAWIVRELVTGGKLSVAKSQAR
jgi:hypothetical protein